MAASLLRCVVSAPVRRSYDANVNSGSVDILGVPVDPIGWIELRERALDAVRGRHRLTVMYANVHVVNSAQREIDLLEALRSADVVYCDGEGVRLAARMGGHSLPERMTGADFVYDLARCLSQTSARIYWLGGAEGIARAATGSLSATYPGFTVVGTHHGFFAKQGPETDAVIAHIEDARPDILFVGMGTPVQEQWVARNRAALSVPVVWCIGATADFVAGTQPRGPRLLTQHGFEWLARLLSDPRRLFWRYVIGNPLFLARVLRRQLHRDP